ncbi:MAG: MFS transporter [Leptospiraceae bacterium]|nr:MFS transporter [Leptospiraceae bacterium]
MKKLTAPIKAGYSFAESGLFSVELLMRLYMLKFYTDVVGLSPSLAGAAAAIAVIWDAVTDPAMGMISDRTQFKSGKRRPYILAGGILLCLFVIAMFNPPSLSSETGKFLYLMISYLTLNTGVTILSVPHAALAGELTYDRNVRTGVFAWRLFSGNIGLLLGTLLPGFMLARYAEKSTAYSYAAFGIALLVLTSALISWLSTRGFDKPASDSSAQKKFQFFSETKSVITNPGFRWLLPAYMVSYIGVSINSTLALYYYEYRLKLSTDETNLILGIFIVVWSISLLFWLWISKKYGKKWPAFLGVALLGLMTIFAYPAFPAGSLAGPLAAAIAGGILVGSILLLDSLVADIVDWDELITGDHREGLYFGFWKMGIKMSRAVALALSGYMLSLAGFIPNTPPDDATAHNIALLFGPGVGSFFIAGALIFIFFPLTDKKHAEIQKKFSEKKSET